MMAQKILSLFIGLVSISSMSEANDDTPAASKSNEAPVQSATLGQESKAQSLTSAAEKPSAITDYSCSMNNAKRSVRVVYEKDGAKTPCKVNYVRDAASGEEKTLYSATAQEGYCEQKAAEFAEKLKSTGWTCSTP
jgi:hypothetical protein